MLVRKPKEASSASTGNRALSRFFSGEHVVAISYGLDGNGSTPIVPHAVAVDLTDPKYVGQRLLFPDESQDAVFADGTLEHISDYRRAIADWFRLLRIGGFLVIVVPHQFLFERKLLLPSRFDVSHKRYYTAASLLLEIEEALDPHDYRIRHLEDNDIDFDYNVPPEEVAVGCSDIVVVLERIRRPDYADAVLEDVQPKSKGADRLRIPRAPAAADGRTIYIRSEPSRVQKIAVMKLDHRGDFILARPAMEELRRLFPSAALTLICGHWNAPEAAGLGIYDDIVPFDFFRESGASDPNQEPAQLVEHFAAMMEGRKFDLAIDLRVDPDTRELLSEIDADHRAGFGDPQRFPFLDIALPFINPTGLRQWRRIGFERFISDVGALGKRAIAFKGRPYLSFGSENLVCGPHIDLGPGSYLVAVDIAPLGKRFSVGIEVRADNGAEILRKWRPYMVRRHRPATFDLYLEKAKSIEIRVMSRRCRFIRPFRFRSCRVARFGEWHGPHQQELMYLLASMVGMRMSAPFKLDEVAP